MLERQGELALPPPVRAQVVGLSAATVDRLLRAPRAREGASGRRPWAASPATAALRAQVPVRTAAEWAAVAPGECQADLVLHCGETTQGFHLTTLVTVDVASGWTELEAVWGKGMQRVGAAVHETRRRLPVALRALHTDNGGEFLNELLVPYCRRVGVRLTRGRPYRKNDQAHVEQKNGAVVRRLVGYDRFASKAAFAQLQRLYGLVRLYVNFLQPVRKLVAKERVGAKVRKRFDTARTPYQRLLTTGQLDEATAAALAQRYAALNPVTLRTDLDAALAALWRLAERPARPRKRRNEAHAPEGTRNDQAANENPTSEAPTPPSRTVTSEAPRRGCPRHRWRGMSVAPRGRGLNENERLVAGAREHSRSGDRAESEQQVFPERWHLDAQVAR